MSSVVTFYSFKGGVGRTMALANVAVLLAQRGKRVLAVDWDLEAPGLDRYFEARLVPSEGGLGLLDLLAAAARSGQGAADAMDWRRYVSTVELHGLGQLDVMTAGTQDDEYLRKLQALDWEDFFANRQGGAFVEALREEWKAAYGVTLVDSRTGYTDAGGVCTVQLPDALVAVFTANRQSVDGVRDAVARAQSGRQELAYDRSPLLVLPLPSRWDGRVETDEATRWLRILEGEMGEYYDHWLPMGTSYARVLERTKVPHIAKFSFGEKLPVLEASLTDPEGMGIVFDAVASLIDADFQGADRVLLGEQVGTTSVRVAGNLDGLVDDLESRIEAELPNRAMSLLIWLFAGYRAVSTALLMSLVISTLVPTTWIAVPCLVVVLTVNLALSMATDNRKAQAGALRLLLHRLSEARVLYGTSPERLRQAYEDISAEFRGASGSSTPSRTSS